MSTNARLVLIAEQAGASSTMEDSSIETGVGASIAVLSIILVGLRFYVRYYMHVGFKWDDWLILVSLIFVIATDILVVYANSIAPNGAYVASTPGIQYSPEDVLYTKLSYIATVLYFAITSTTKLSILLLYNRLFSVNGSIRRQMIILSIAVIGYGLGSIIANLLNCIPIEYTWINNLADPRFCFNYNIFWFATGIVEAVLDLFILALPIGIVVRLHLTTRKRIAISSVFLVGIFVIASGLLKAGYGYVPGSRQPSFLRTSIWTTVHSGTGIICACLPVCWPLIARFREPKDWPWVRYLASHERWYSLSGWSRLRPGSPRRDTTIGGREYRPKREREYELAMRVIITEPSQAREEASRINDGAQRRDVESDAFQ
ncbi:hypothetical protein F5B17DRAFT_433715 [Nemania serpens]|nr:hypothetical protein F5B17DRAFT_433715 [Nemania serpens]